MSITWEKIPVFDDQHIHQYDDFGYKNLALGFVVCVLKDLSLPSRGYLLMIQEGPDILTGGRGRTFVTPGSIGSMHWPTAEAARGAGEDYIHDREAIILLPRRAHLAQRND